LGTFCISPGVAAATIATSGAVRLASTRPVHNYKAMLFNYVLDEETFICGGPINNGGVTVKWFVQNFIKEQKEKDFEKVFGTIDSIAPGSEGLLFLPYLLGERAPVWDSKSSGVFFGIRTQHTQTHFLRAVVEGVCFALYEVLKMLEESAPVTEIRVSGGFTKSEKWMQLLSTITGKKVHLLQTKDASATGAGLMALKSLQIIHSYESLQQDNFIQSFEPNAQEHKVYEKYFTLYQQLYPSLKATMHELYTITVAES
jgi:gluconokinase